MSKRPQAITDAELAMLRVLWENGPQTATALTEARAELFDQTPVPALPRAERNAARDGGKHPGLHPEGQRKPARQCSSPSAWRKRRRRWSFCRICLRSPLHRPATRSGGSGRGSPGWQSWWGAGAMRAATRRRKSLSGVGATHVAFTLADARDQILAKAASTVPVTAKPAMAAAVTG